jgi:beta-mannosidase
LVTEFIIGDEIVSSNSLFFRPFKELQLPAPTLEKSISIVPGGFDISLTSEVLAKNVYIQIGDEDGDLSDNYFDLLPGEVKTIRLQTEITAPRLNEILTIQTLLDAF